jgi:hypothetical protein
MTNEMRGPTGAPSASSIDEKKQVLDHVRPTVVVRRRIYEPSAVPAAPPDEEIDSGPPSSVNVARALASLRADELARLEEIVRSDDADGAPPAPPVIEAAPESEAPITVESRPSVAIGREITVTELARRMALSREDLVASLVTSGFFSITPKSTLPRETAKVAAAAFGWDVTEKHTPASAGGPDTPEHEPASHERHKGKTRAPKTKTAR